MPTQSKEEWGVKEASNLTYLGAHGLGLCFRPFLGWGMGSEALFFGWLSMLIMIGYAAFAQCQGMFVYLMLWLVACMIQRWKTMKLMRAGIIEHSRFQGYSIFLHPRVQSGRLVKSMEMLTVAGAGILLMLFGQIAMGQFFVVGSFAIGLEYGIQEQITKRRVQQMRDGAIEGKFYGDLYRGRRSDF